MTSQHSETDSTNDPPVVAGRQFSVRTIMLATIVVGCWFGLFGIVPHIAVFAMGVFLAAISVYFVVRSRRNNQSSVSNLTVFVFAPIAWIWFYVVSIGPVQALMYAYFELDWPGSDALFAAFEVFYAPVIWLNDSTWLQTPLTWYTAEWGWPL